jgi:hypothetical protein
MEVHGINNLRWSNAISVFHIGRQIMLRPSRLIRALGNNLRTGPVSAFIARRNL